MLTTVLTTKAKTPLDRDVVMDRALEVADAEGLGAVTIRRLAQDLNVTPMALYWHFRRKDDLLAGLGQRLLEGIQLPAPSSEGWSEQLRAVLDVVVASLRAHPAVAPLAALQILGCEEGLELTERTLEILAAGGFAKGDAANIAHWALKSMIILVTDAPGFEGPASPEDRADHERAKRLALASLSPQRYPRVVAAADVLTSCADEDAYFDFGIDMLVSGAVGLSTRR
jgi:TetR/AcrR family tetracycline transcriptional repressor